MKLYKVDLQCDGIDYSKLYVGDNEDTVTERACDEFDGEIIYGVSISEVTDVDGYIISVGK